MVGIDEGDRSGTIGGATVIGSGAAADRSLSGSGANGASTGIVGNCKVTGPVGRVIARCFPVAR